MSYKLGQKFPKTSRGIIKPEIADQIERTNLKSTLVLFNLFTKGKLKVLTKGLFCKRALYSWFWAKKIVLGFKIQCGMVL